MKVGPAGKIMLPKFTESPYLAHQLLVFDDRQLITVLPGMIVRGSANLET
jgi:hypothetical protein